MPVRAVEPDKGGRGIESLRLFWMPNPVGGPHERHLVLHQFDAVCKALPHRAGWLPFHKINTAMRRRNAPSTEGLDASLSTAQTAPVFARVTQHGAMHPVADRPEHRAESGASLGSSTVTRGRPPRTNHFAFKKRQRRMLGAGH